MGFSYVLSGKEYRKGLELSSRVLGEVASSKEVAYSHRESALITNKIVTSLRYVQEKSGLSAMIQGMLLEACYRSEIVGANSSDVCSSFSLALVNEILQRRAAGHDIKSIRKELEKEFVQFKDSLTSNKPTEAQLHSAILDAVENPLLATMVIESVNLAGLEGVVIPDHTVNATPSIELITGYHFKTSPAPSFLGPDGKWKKERVRILLIDGVIEQVSEIHGVLEALSSTREPAIFVTRGYGPEVIQTLKVNNERRTLRVMPVTVPFDLEGINMLNDIAVVCGADLVSSAKGQVVSSIRYDSLVQVDGITCQKGSMIISNSRTENNVRIHAHALSDRMEREKVEDVSELILKRIRSLNSQYVNLKVSSKSEQEKLHDLEAVDMGLRVVKTVMSNGVMNLDDIKMDGMLGAALEKMQAKTRMKPVLSVLSAVQHGLAFALMATSVEAAVLTQ